MDGLADAGRKRGRTIVVTGDFNAVIGERRAGEDHDIIGKFGIRERNNRGASLVEWATSHRVSIMNTRFQKHPDAQWTHAGGEDGAMNRQFDFVGIDVSKRWWATDASTTEDLTLGADHRGVSLQIREDPGWKKFKKKEIGR